MKVFTRLPVLLTTFGAWRKTPASLRCTSCQTSPSNCHTSLECILRKNGESREGKETETTDRMSKELKRMISSYCLQLLAMTCWKMQWKKATPNRTCRKTFVDLKMQSQQYGKYIMESTSCGLPFMTIYFIMESTSCGRHQWWHKL